jgi:bis(5'-nucleosyl)-tetraphosphatase (symmetrical)
MAHYLVGDIQGCDEALERLLDVVAFSPSRDTLWLLGDLVNRGPDSLAVLRRVMGYGAAARCVLGNHDLHLLTVAYGIRKAGRGDTLEDILQAPDKWLLIDWLRRQPLALLEDFAGQSFLMVHAGVLPQWTAAQAIRLAGEVESVLQSDNIAVFLQQLYGNHPARWQEPLTGMERLRVIVNAMTRLRFCSADGEMEFQTKESAGSAPAGFMPWFTVPGRKTADVCVAFGHWSTLGSVEQEGVLALDTGCVWGGCLSAYKIDPIQPEKNERIRIRCPQVRQPGV